MRLFTRLKDAIFNKVKDPSENINQYLRNVEKELGAAKAEIAAVMEEELRCKRELDACSEEAEKLQMYADKAVADGYDNDACQFLERKAVLDRKIAVLQEAYAAASANTEKVREMHDRLADDLESINARKAEIKAELGK